MPFRPQLPMICIRKGALLLTISSFISLSHAQLPRKGLHFSLRTGAAFYPLKPGGNTPVSRYMFNPVTELQAGVYANRFIINLGVFYFSRSYSYSYTREWPAQVQVQERRYLHSIGLSLNPEVILFRRQKHSFSLAGSFYYAAGNPVVQKALWDGALKHRERNDLSHEILLGGALQYYYTVHPRGHLSLKLHSLYSVTGGKAEKQSYASPGGGFISYMAAPAVSRLQLGIQIGYTYTFSRDNQRKTQSP